MTVMLVVLSLLPCAEKSASKSSVELEAQTIVDSLPGKKAFLFAELTKDGPEPVYSVHADEQFAIGSGFKLFILGTLIDEVNQGRRHNDDVIPLQKDLIGPPSSELASWPIGSPVTLHTLALKMISISDNTATDHLRSVLGRERVEKQMRDMGHAKPAVNQPLLSTREMTMLRDKAAPDHGKTYARLDEAGRRRYLETQIAALHDFDKLDFDTAAYGTAEWYATPLDMARALDWIRSHTEDDRASFLLREVLAVQPMLKHDAKKWSFVGFKGGSEDQILAGNWLLRHKNGKWYSFHLFCNSPDKKLSREDMTSAVQKILLLIEKRLD